MEANLLRELSMPEMNELQKKRARQLAFMLTMHTKDRALQMITTLSDPNLETFPGRVGAITQRTGPSDADTVVAVSVKGRQRSGPGGVGTTCATV